MEEKKFFKISLRTGILLFLVFLLIVALVGMYFYFNPKEENPDAKALNNENSLNNIESNDTSNQLSSDSTFKCPYENYKDLNLEWCFAEKLTEFNISSGDSNEKIIIEDEIVYFEKDGNKKRLTSINEKAKCLAPYETNELVYLFILTDEGNILRLGNEQNTASDLIELGKVDEFEKIDLPGKAVNMTYGNNSSIITEDPYFLLASGELINENGNKYEEIESN